MNNNNVLKIITTVGTSLLSNYQQDALTGNDSVRFSAFRGKNLEWINYDETKNKPRDKKRKVFNDNDWKILETDQGKNNSWSEKIIKAEIDNKISSAELKSIDAIVGDKDKATIEIHLLTSYTLDGYLCGWLLKQILEKKGYKADNVKLEIIQDLTIDSADKFQDTAIHKLTQYVKDNAKNAVLNITGGYKAIIPFMTILGQLQGLDMQYIYEDSEKLIPIKGNLPFNFDWEIAQIATQYLKVESNKNVVSTEVLTNDEKVLKNLTDNGLIFNDGQKWQVSAIGQILKSYVEEKSEVAKGTLGLFLEYKFYEYFSEKEDAYYARPKKLDLEYFVNKQTYEVFNMSEMRLRYPNQVSQTHTHQEIKHFPLKSIDKDLATLEEIDLVFDIRSNNNQKVICEIKSEKELGGASEQLKKDIYAYRKKFDVYPNELAIFFYKIKFQFEPTTDLANKNKNTISNIKNELSNFFKKQNIVPIPLRIMATHINLTNSFKVDYKSLLRKPLNPEWVDNKPVLNS